MYVLDTNTLIDFFRGEGDVARRLLATPPARVAVPVIAVYELEVGIAKSRQPRKRRGQLAELLDAVRVLPFDRSAAAESARVRAALEKAGAPIGPLDTLVAGTTLANRGCLVTRNTREFRRVPGLEVTDWY